MSRTRGRGLRRRISLTLVGVALISVVLLSGVNYVFARLLIDDSVESQLVAVRDTRVQALELGFERIEAQVSALAANPSLATALTELSAGYEQIDQDLSPAQIEGLAELYDREVLPPFVDAGVEIPAADLVPDSVAGRYLQHHYIAENPDGFDDRDALNDAGDGSLYSAAHATHHPLLRALKENARLSDLLLVDVDSLDVVYSTQKRIEFGTDAAEGPYATDAAEGPYATDGLGQVLDQLSTVAAGETVPSDSFFYVPTRGAPVFFLASVVRSGPEVIGAIIAVVPVEALTEIMTAGQSWELLGLGDTGESYLVGVDGTLRSDSRLWIENPDEYLRRHVDRYDDQDRADLIGTVGSPVLLQEVDNEAVTEAQDGEVFLGTVRNYLGTETLAASGPANLGGLGWVVVVEQDTSEARTELNALLRAILVVLAVLLPAIAVVGAILARNLTRPAQTLVGASSRIAGGDLDTEVEDLGKNELGDLGRQLEGVARQLEAREQAIVDEEGHINDMLLAVLPARVADRVRRGENAIDDIFDTATVISLTVDAIPEAAGAEQDIVLEITDRIDEAFDELMARFDVERIRRSSGSQLFETGFDEDDVKASAAVEFALSVVQRVAEIGEELGYTLKARAGLSAGEVATGVLGTTQVSFGVWGDPAGRAVALGSLAASGQVLADETVVEQLGPEWDIGPNEELPGLADDVEAHVIRRAGSARS